MHKKTLSFIAFSALGFLLILPFSRCTKTVETKTDTLIVKIDTSVNLQKNLLVYLPFNKNLADSSGNKNNGAKFGALKYTTDKNNTDSSAVLFDGTSAYILINDSGRLSPSSFTISAQVYCTSSTHQNVYSKINFSTSNTISWGLALFGGAPSYPNSASFAVLGNTVACGQFEPVAYSDLVYSMEDIQLNRWYNITCVFDKGVEKIYLNGTLRNAITRGFVTPKQCSEAQVVLGAWWQSDPLFFKGKMDEFRMYGRALNDTEIARLANL